MEGIVWGQRGLLLWSWWEKQRGVLFFLCVLGSLLRFFSLHHLWQTEVLSLSFNLNSCVCLRFRCSESGEGTDGGGKSDSNSVLPLSLLCFSLCVPGLIASLYFHLCVYRISISLSLLLSPFPRRLSLSFIASLLRSVCIWRCSEESQVWVWTLIGKYDLGFRVCRFFFFFGFVLWISGWCFYKGLHFLLFFWDKWCLKVSLPSTPCGFFKGKIVYVSFF